MLPTEVTTAVIMWLPWLLKDQSEDSHKVGKMSYWVGTFNQNRNSRYNGISKNYLWETNRNCSFSKSSLPVIKRLLGNKSRDGWRQHKLQGSESSRLGRLLGPSYPNLWWDLLPNSSSHMNWGSLVPLGLYVHGKQLHLLLGQTTIPHSHGTFRNCFKLWCMCFYWKENVGVGHGTSALAGLCG